VQTKHISGDWVAGVNLYSIEWPASSFMPWHAVGRTLCQTVSELMARVARDNCSDDNDDGLVSVKCLMLKQKLDALLATLNEEAATTSFTTVSS